MLRPELQLALTLGHVKSTLIKRIGRRSTGASWGAFNARLDEHFPALLSELSGLYGQRPDFLPFLEELSATAWEGWSERPRICAHWTPNAKRSPTGFNRKRCWVGFATWICLRVTSRA